MRCTLRASAGPNHLGLRALQATNLELFSQREKLVARVQVETEARIRNDARTQVRRCRSLPTAPAFTAVFTGVHGRSPRFVCCAQALQTKATRAAAEAAKLEGQLAEERREREKREQVIAYKETRLQQHRRRLEKMQVRHKRHCRSRSRGRRLSSLRLFRVAPQEKIREMNAKHTSLEAFIGLKARQVRPLQVSKRPAASFGDAQQGGRAGGGAGAGVRRRGCGGRWGCGRGAGCGRWAGPDRSRNSKTRDCTRVGLMVECRAPPPAQVQNLELIRKLHEAEIRQRNAE